MKLYKVLGRTRDSELILQPLAEVEPLGLYNEIKLEKFAAKLQHGLDDVISDPVCSDGVNKGQNHA